MSSKTKKFVQGAVLLSVAGIITKFINMFFKIPLQALIGDEGLTYYYNPYPIYTLFMAIFIAGISSAISKNVSEKVAYGKYLEAQIVYKKMFKGLLLLGGLSSITLFVMADFIVKIAAWEPSTVYVIRAMSPTPFILAVIGGIRGYFQGLQIMLPSAGAQIVESVGKVSIGMGLVYMFVQSGLNIPKAAAGAALGLTAGTFLSMLFLILVYIKKSKKMRELIKEDTTSVQVYVTNKEIIKTICLIAIPIAIGTACYTLINFIDSFTIVKKLTHLGLEYQIANQLMGQKIKADTYINIPMILSASLVVSILPAISEAVALKDKKELKEKIDVTTKLSYLIGLPASIGIFILTEPLLKIFFFTDPSGGEVLRLYSLSILFIILAQSYAAVLQGVGKIYVPLMNLLIAVTIKWVLNMMLVNDLLLVQGAIYSSIVAYGTLAILNYIAVYKYTNYKFGRSLLIKGLFSTGVMAIATYITYLALEARSSSAIVIVFIGVLVGLLVYGLMLIVTRTLDEKDFEFIPYGKKIYTMVNKVFYKKHE